MHTIKKKRKQSIETVPEGAQVLDLPKKDFKPTIIHTFKDIKEAMSKEVKQKKDILSNKISKNKHKS